MRKVLISSVITDFEEYRQAARRAAEIIADKLVIFRLEEVKDKLIRGFYGLTPRESE